MASKRTTNVTEAKELKLSADAMETFIGKLAADVEQDEKSMTSWIEDKRKDYDRRYQRGADRGTNFPWPGASAFDYPGSDIMIDEVSPALHNIHFGGRRIVEAIALDAESVPRAVKAGMAMESLLRYRMCERGVPDYYRQTSLSIESFLQHGVAYDKVYYSYLTEARREVFTRATLPDVLQQIQVVDEIPPQQQAMLAEQGIFVIPRKDWGLYAEQVEGLIVQTLNLDLQERMDRVAAGQMMAFIKANNPDSQVDILVSQVLEDSPRIVNCDIESIILPPGTRRIATASRVRHDMWFNHETVLQRAENNQWDPAVVDELLNNSKTRNRAQNSWNNTLHWAERERTQTIDTMGNDDERFRVSEVYCYKLNDKKVPVPVVITMDMSSKSVLRAVEYNYAHGSWPFEESLYEPGNVFASRGIPKKIKHLEKHMSGLFRAELNGLMMQTSQSFTYRNNSGINPQKMRWMPHLMIPVREHDDLQPIPVNVTALALERPMLIMQGLITKAAGGRNTNEINAARQDRPPTATQIQDTSLARQSSIGLRGMNFQNGRARLFRQAWSLWRQFGPDEFYAQVTGGEAMEKVSQHQIRGNFSIVPCGAVADMDPDFRVNQSMQVLDLLMKTQPLVQQDPRYFVDIPAATKDVLDRMDPQLSMRLMRERTQEEQQQFIQEQQAAAQRAQELAAEAERLQAGAAITPEGAAALLREIRSITPHKDLQPIIQGSKQAQAATRDSMAAVNGAS